MLTCLFSMQEISVWLLVKCGIKMRKIKIVRLNSSDFGKTILKQLNST